MAWQDMTWLCYDATWLVSLASTSLSAKKLRLGSPSEPDQIDILNTQTQLSDLRRPYMFCLKHRATTLVACLSTTIATSLVVEVTEDQCATYLRYRFMQPLIRAMSFYLKLGSFM